MLAQELRSSLAIDERRGRRIASSFELETTGTVGILLAAKQSALIPEVRPELDALAQAGVHLARKLYRQALTIAGEA